MADREAAEIYGKVFDILAEACGPETLEAAKKIWDTMGGYDFQPYQLGCDEESLISLGLAKLVPGSVLNKLDLENGPYEEDRDTLVYIDEDHWDDV